jgi:hypothetical protein
MSEIAAMSSEDRAHKRARRQDISFQMAVWREHGLIPESVRRKGRAKLPPKRDYLHVTVPDVFVADTGAVAFGAVPETETQRIIREIFEFVCDLYQVHPRSLVSARRDAHLVVPRHHAMSLMADRTSMSLTQIGRYFGGRDHSSVCYALKRHEERMAEKARALA